MTTYIAFTPQIVTITHPDLGMKEFEVVADSTVEYESGNTIETSKAGINSTIKKITPKDAKFTGVKLATNKETHDYLAAFSDNGNSATITMSGPAMPYTVTFEGVITGEIKWSFADGSTEVEFTASDKVDMSNK